MTLGCYDGCGATVADDVAAMQAGWSFLVISTRWRCGAALRRVVGITGGSGSTPDTLPADSRGALPIAAVAVKG